MASLRRVPWSRFWIACITLPDGRRTNRSTGTTDRRKAQKIAMKLEDATRLARAGRFNEAAARKTVADIYAIGNETDLPSDTLGDYLDRWLKRKELEVKESSYPEYAKTAELVREILAAKNSRPMDAVTREDAVRFRDTIAQRVSPATANKRLKIARVIWRSAQRDGVVTVNPFADVEILKYASGNATKRRAFSTEELRAVLRECDPEWRSMVLFGLYTGQRLGDIAALTWRHCDVEKREIRLRTRKTGRSMVIPLARPLLDLLATMPVPDDPDAVLFPRASELATSTLSRQFGEILANAGLAPKRTHMKAEKGRGRCVRRNTNPLSFHCLRHTATSMLVNAGISRVVAQEIIGHDSEAVNRAYTHIDKDTLQSAMDKLPDLTAETETERLSS